MTVYNLEDFDIYTGIDGVPGGWIAYSLLNAATAETADAELAKLVKDTIANNEGREATDEEIDFLNDIKSFDMV